MSMRFIQLLFIGSFFSNILAANEVKKETLQETISIYLKLLTHIKASKTPEQKDLDLLKAKAKILLGIVDGVSIKFSDKAKLIIEKLNTLLKEFESQKTDEKNAKNLKINRDISNIKEIIRFIKINSALLDQLYEYPDLIDTLLERCPRSIPSIGSEITTMLNLIINNDDIKKSMSEMRDFAASDEDGTYLMSLILSKAFDEDSDPINFKLLIESNDLNKLEDRKYLKVR